MIVRLEPDVKGILRKNRNDQICYQAGVTETILRVGITVYSKTCKKLEPKESGELQESQS